MHGLMWLLFIKPEINPLVSMLPVYSFLQIDLSVDTLAFGYILPTAERIRDSHWLEGSPADGTPKYIPV